MCFVCAVHSVYLVFPEVRVVLLKQLGRLTGVSDSVGDSLRFLAVLAFDLKIQTHHFVRHLYGFDSLDPDLNVEAELGDHIIVFRKDARPECFVLCLSRDRDPFVNRPAAVRKLIFQRQARSEYAIDIQMGVDDALVVLVSLIETQFQVSEMRLEPLSERSTDVQIVLVLW